MLQYICILHKAQINQLFNNDSYEYKKLLHDIKHTFH
jgi:hypothetical protein